MRGSKSPCGVWGLSLAHVGAFWGRLWNQLDAKLTSKIDLQSMQKSIKNSVTFKIDLWEDFDGFG